MPEQGDILLVPIPFTDLSSQKRRPVIVVSNNSYNQKTTDLVVVAMTSNPIETDYSFTLTSDDLEKRDSQPPGQSPRGQDLRDFQVHCGQDVWSGE